MNIEQLHFFIEVANLKSMRLVSEKLFVTPQYISKTIQNFEKQLNLKLFQRNRYGVELTKEGEIIYPFVQDVYNRLIHLYETLPQAIAENKDISFYEPQIRLDIGTSGNYSSFFIDILNMLQTKYPNIQPNIISKESNDLLFSLDEEICDLIFCNCDQKYIDFFAKANSAYNIYPISQSEIYLFVDKFSPHALKKSIKLDELEHIPLTFVKSSDTVTPLFLEILHEKNINPHILFTASSPQCLSSYTVKSNAYMIGSTFLKQISEKRGDNNIAIPIGGLEPIWQIVLIKNDFAVPQLAQDILGFIRNVFAKNN